VPSHPAALLGTCFHDMVAAATSGRLDGADLEAARDYFDRVAVQAYEAAHPLIRVKFSSPQKIPYYFLMRERAAVYAHAHGWGEPLREGGGGGAVVETMLRSRDGLVVGRPDWIDVSNREVIDFKTGRVADDEAHSVSPREERQLRLYAGLAVDNDVAVERGTIVRATGQRVTASITPEAAQGELEQARAAMRDFNEAVEHGPDFARLADPSPEACRFCPCIPFCGAFWREAGEAWAREVGVHAEGTVRDVGRAELEAVHIVALEVDVRAGTVPHEIFWIEHIPEDWVTADGSSAIEPGNVVRLIDLRVVTGEEGWTLRADRIMTAVWRVADESEREE
jgi:PD-(D/E)XK nuclease superfamily